MQRWLAGLGVVLALAGCGGGGSSSGPTVSAQPADASAAVGSTATFAVTAAGAGIGYVWQASPDGSTWADLAGATATSYTTGPLALADDGRHYRVVVSAGGASVVSAAARLTVTPAVVAPAITVPPASVTVTAPGATVFGVTATGTTLGYQWQRSTDGGASWSPIGGATAATYDTGATTLAMNGHRFRVDVANPAGHVTSADAILGVDPAPTLPTFATAPASQSVVAGSAAMFSATATGTPAPALQWQRSTDGGASYADIAGATAASHTTGATTLAQSGERYRAVASNGAGSVASAAATLTVVATAQVPVITTDPTAVSVTAPAAASFTAAASGVPTPTWQWQLSTDGGATYTNIAGATGPGYTTPTTQGSDDGRRYRAVAGNTAGTAFSAAAVLSVGAAASLAIDTPAALPDSVVGAPYSVTLAASGGTAPYQWSIVGTLPATLALEAGTGVISGTAPPQEGFYSWAVRVEDSASPSQASQKTVQLSTLAICDHGWGFLTVGGAPAAAGGKLCPQRVAPPGDVNSLGLVSAVWADETPGVFGVFEYVSVSFELATGHLVSVSYSLNYPNGLLTYLCTVPASPPNHPGCSGVTLDAGGGTVTFLNTEVGSGTSQPFVLNGMIRY